MQPHAQRRRPTDVGNGLQGLGRRCRAGAAVSMAGFVVAFITDVVRASPGDDMVVIGVELLCLAGAIPCALLAIVAAILTAHGPADSPSDQHAADLEWAFDLGSDVARAFPSPASPPQMAWEESGR